MREHHEGEAEALRERVVQLESQLPEGMRHCTIVFVECERGHGRLQGTNWTDGGCPHCKLEGMRRINRAQARTVGELRVSRDEWRDIALADKRDHAKRELDNAQALDGLTLEVVRLRGALTGATLLAAGTAIAFCDGMGAVVLTIFAVAVHAWGTR
jgi:hypothetical protein